MPASAGEVYKINFITADLDPTIAFRIFDFPVHWYGIIIGAGLGLAAVLAVFIACYRGFKRDLPLELILWLFIPAVIGARLYFLIFNGGPWDRAFAIWDGGIAIYGAVIGGAIGLAVWCYIKKVNYLRVADVVAPCLILGQAIGRWGNYVNSEVYGLEITNPAWQMFPWAVEIGTEWHMATFFYESMANFVIFGVLLLLLIKTRIRGIVVACYFILYGAVRFVLEFVRLENLMAGSLQISQVVSAICIAGGAALLVYILVRRKQGKWPADQVLPWKEQGTGNR
ncbi:MAG: prolipoprotein diacylglyceryl transferase [Firmicutes bacterium]|nr:prolipoprotein diacylglyceryl transferase [Bacillota bacterium]